MRIKYLRLTEVDYYDFLAALKTLISDCAIIMDSDSYDELRSNYREKSLNKDLHIIIGDTLPSDVEEYEIAEFSLVQSLEQAIAECEEHCYKEAVLVVL